MYAFELLQIDVEAFLRLILFKFLWEDVNNTSDAEECVIISKRLMYRVSFASQN